jgi:hypothetical protein
MAEGGKGVGGVSCVMFCVMVVGCITGHVCSLARVVGGRCDGGHSSQVKSSNSACLVVSVVFFLSVVSPR